VCSEEVELRPLLHPFDDRGHPECLTKLEHGRHDRGGPPVGGDRGEKRAVDLEHADRKVAQAGQR